MTFPTSEDVARKLLLYKLGICLEGGTVEELAQRVINIGTGWPIVLLNDMEYQFIAHLHGWNDIPQGKRYEAMLGGYYRAMRAAGITLKWQYGVSMARQNEVILTVLTD